MIFDIKIKNFILIDDVLVQLDNGFNIMTGETGAGKSIIFKAIDVVLGLKSTKEYLKDKEKSSFIQLSFDIANLNTVKSKLFDVGIELEDDILTISREIKPSGKSVSRINNVVTPISFIKSLREDLVEFTNQNEQQSLLKKSNHVVLLDEYIIDEINDIKNRVESLYFEIKKTEKEYEFLSISDEEIERSLDIYRFQLSEIEDVNFFEGEDIELEKEYEYMKNFEIILNTVNLINEKVFADNSAFSFIDEARLNLDKIALYSKELENMSKEFNEVYYTLETLSSDIRNYIDDFNYDEEKLYSIENRINLINNLKRKYGKNYSEINEFKMKLISEIKKYSSLSSQKEEYRKKIEMLKREYFKEATKLSNIRKKNSKTFISTLKRELNTLEMPNVEFDIIFNEKSGIFKNGIDDIEFYISTNLGKELKSLSDVVSGGELSRILLAIKTLNSNKGESKTLIFDEIDAGISGKTATVTASKLLLLSKKFQIISVTHLPQIAVFAKNHLYIEKKDLNNTSITYLKRLDDKEKVFEVARMLSGESVTTASLKSANELFQGVKTMEV